MSDLVMLQELIKSTSWPEVKAALSWLFPEETKQDHLAGYRKVFRELRALPAEPNPMRMVIEVRPLLGAEGETQPELFGRDGTLNRELSDCPPSKRDAEYGHQLTEYSLSLQPWSKWLGMRIEAATLRDYAPAQIVAFALFEMTFHGFTEQEHREVLEELQRRVSEIESITAEEREAKLIPADQVFARIRAKLGIDSPDGDV